jgi:hypothetical protein
MTLRNGRTPWGLIAGSFCVSILGVSHAAGAQQSDVSGIGLGLLQGVIRAGSGLPEPGTRVIVDSLDEPRLRAVFTGADGSFVIRSLKAGRYRVIAVKDGFGRFAPDGRGRLD